MEAEAASTNMTKEAPGIGGKPFPGTGLAARTARIILLASVDAAVIVVVAATSYFVWAHLVRQQPLDVYLRLSPLVLLFILGFGTAGLYPGFGLGSVETLRRIWLLLASLFLVLSSGSFAFRVPHHYSRMTFLMTFVGCLVGLPIIRFAVLSILQKARWWREPVLVVGANELARRTIHVLRSARSLGYFPVRVAPLAGETSSESFEELPVLADIESAPELARRGIRVVLVVHEGGEPPHGVIHDLQHHFRHVIMIRGGQELPVEGVEIRNLGGVLAVEFRNQLLRRRNRITKRALDIVLASVGLVLALPLIAVSALLLKLSSRGPVFFNQTRDASCQAGARSSSNKRGTGWEDGESQFASCARCTRTPRSGSSATWPRIPGRSQSGT
jgi:hypothetical protein